jgi:hypothetical protein
MRRPWATDQRTPQQRFRTPSTAAVTGDDEVVLLPAGTYRVTETIRVPSHRVLRGEGQDTTVISYEGPSGGRSGIALSGWPNFSTGETSVGISAGAVKGSTTITVESAPDAAMGDLMLIDQLNDGEFVDPDGVEGKCTYCGRADGDRTLGQIVEITAISGNDITFNIPLYWTYSAGLAPQATPAAAKRPLCAGPAWSPSR